VRIVDEITGALATTLGLHGRPVWSHDGTKVASVDTDGVVRVADVAGGLITVAADLGVSPWTFDSCGVSGHVVDWSPDDTSVLVSFTEFTGDRQQTVAVLRVDGSERRVLWQHRPPAFGLTTVAARWLQDGSVSVIAADDGDLTLERGDPWNGFPAQSKVIPRPTPDAIESLTLSPNGTITAVARLGLVNGHRTAATTASVLLLDNITGTSRPVAEHEAPWEIVFTPDGRHVAFSEGTAVIVTPTTTGNDERVFALPTFGFHASWSSDGTAVLVGGRSLHRIDVASGQTSTVLPESQEANEEYMAASPGNGG
jgi:WD40 repeat protein